MTDRLDHLDTSVKGLRALFVPITTAVPDRRKAFWTETVRRLKWLHSRTSPSTPSSSFAADETSGPQPLSACYYDALDFIVWINYPNSTAFFREGQGGQLEHRKTVLRLHIEAATLRSYTNTRSLLTRIPPGNREMLRKRASTPTCRLSGVE
jgi:hypothetical protein